MQCKVCGQGELIEAEYKTGDFCAPALKCARCQAIHLDEGVAKSEKDRDSVRRAVAARLSARNSYDPDTNQRSASLSFGNVEAVINEVELVLAEARVGLDFLAQMTDGEMAKAVADVRRCNQQIRSLMKGLGAQCAPTAEGTKPNVDR